METPFVFGKIATARNFTDRKKETERLFLNFSSSVNTILISPRRWGKSSLVARAADLTLKKNKNLKFCFIDLNNVRSEEQFYQYLATQVLRNSSNKAEELLENSRRFLGRFIPNITFSPGPGSEFKLGLDWQEVTREPDDILNLAEKIGRNKKVKFIICIDEFQNISEFENPYELQKKLRSHWQKHDVVTYCLYGSKRHMMSDIFTSPSMPFYKFGDILFLEKIRSEDWIPFIQKRFAESGKRISENEALLITILADCHPYYVQQLAQLSWFRTESVCTGEIISATFDSLILQLSMLFQNLTDRLSYTQINFLKALADNVERFSSQEIIREYGLGTSGNIQKIKKMLVSREIIDIFGNKITFLDPLYKAWLSKYYFV